MQEKIEAKRNALFFKFLRQAGLPVLMISSMAFISGTVMPQTSQDADVCGECHEDQVAGLKNTPHAVIDERGLAGRAGAEISCTACHGDATKHIEEETGADILAFKSTDLPIEKSRKCLNCHMMGKGRFFASNHGKAAMDCTTCHAIHTEKPKPRLLKENVLKTCFSCHQDIFSKFNLNERHRLQEGILQCTTCHNPHEPATRERLGGFKQELCFKCHTDKEGPFMYEHASVQIEGCTTCHDPHGSPNRHMLIFQRVADLCFSCHIMVPSFHGNFTPEHNCALCHSAIHGSNLDSHFLK